MQQGIKSYQESLFQYFVMFCYVFIAFFSLSLLSFFETIHSYSFGFKVCFYLFMLLCYYFFHILFLVITRCLLNIKRHLVIVIFCSICLYVRYSYTKKINHNLIYLPIFLIFIILITVSSINFTVQLNSQLINY